MKNLIFSNSVKENILNFANKKEKDLSNKNFLKLNLNKNSVPSTLNNN